MRVQFGDLAERGQENGSQYEEKDRNRLSENVPVHRPVETDRRATDGLLLEPLRVARLLVEVTHRPYEIGVDENDIGLELLSTLRNDSFGLTVLDNDSLDGSVEAEVGTVAFGDLGERFRYDRETSEGVEDTFAVLGVLEEVVGTEGIER